MKRLVAPLLLIAALTTAALFAFELLLRAIGFSAPAWHRPDRQLGWALRPGVSGWFNTEGKAFVQINSAGQRDRERSVDKPANVYRITVLGDAYSEAMHVALEKTYWALLPERLESCGFQPGKRIEVLNFGVARYGTAQAYLTLETTALRYGPDLVLLQFTNGSDVRDNSSALDPERDHRPFFIVDAKGGLRLHDSFASARADVKRTSFGYDAPRKLADYSRVLQLLRDTRDIALMAPAYAQGTNEAGLETSVLAAPRAPLWEDAWRTTEALIAKIGELARRHGAKLAVFTVPYALQAHPDVALRESLQVKYGVVDFTYPDRRIASFAEQNGMLGIMLAPEMQALAVTTRSYLYGFENAQLGFGHWNERGHRAAADIIARQLCANRS